MLKIFIVFVSFFTIVWSLTARTVESDNFILTDEYGRTTAQLTKSGEWTPALFFYDTNGVVRISIGLYEDGVPGVVLNDDKWNAGAIMRLVNNSGDPVVVLKENGQDKYIIDKNGIPGNTWLWGSNIITLVVALLGGIIGWFLFSYLRRSEEDKVYSQKGDFG